MTDQACKRVLVVAGEASGDQHAARLVRQATGVAPGIKFFGLGGDRLRAAGCDVLIDNRAVAAMGLVEVVGKFPAIRRAFNSLKQILHGSDPPDLLLTIDFQEFNLRLAGEARRAGIPVLHFVSPQVWAWRPGRVHKVAGLVDHLAVIFPFEVDCYAGVDLPVSYVGHPLLDDLADIPDKAGCRTQLGCPLEVRIVGLFPGSREGELQHNLPVLLESARLLLSRNPDLRFLLPVAGTVDRVKVEAEVTAANLPLQLVGDDLFVAAGSCDAVLCVSGTATLQTALMQTPLVILFRTSALTFAIGRRLVKLPFAGLPNIIAGRQVVPELLQEKATAENLVSALEPLLSDSAERREMQAGLAEVRKRMGTAGCTDKLFRLILQMLGLMREAG